MRLPAIIPAVFLLLTPQHASAEVINFVVSGKITGSDHGPDAAADIFQIAPIGSNYRFNFSYDTSISRSDVLFFNYQDVPISGNLSIGGEDFSLSQAQISTGRMMYMQDYFALGVNSVPYSETRLAGYQIIDFSLALYDPTFTTLPNASLPTYFDLSEFSSTYVRARFVFGQHGGTGILMSIDDISVASSVPEPLSWAMMIIGFGIIGTARRRKLAAAFASSPRA